MLILYLCLAGVVLVLLGVPAMAVAFFAYSRERCRRNSISIAYEAGGKDEVIMDTDSIRAFLDDPSAAAVAMEETRRRADDNQSHLLLKALLNEKTPNEATADDIKGLSKAEFMRLFQLLPPASLDKLHGEWHCDILAMGLNFPVAYLVLHWKFGRGWWLGKGFDKQTKQGYNTFYHHGHISRSRRFDVLFTGPSAYDEQMSLHLVYRNHNDGFYGNIHDEVRCLNENTFLCLGSLNPRYRNMFNSIPYLIVAPKKPVKPCDTERN